MPNRSCSRLLTLSLLIAPACGADDDSSSTSPTANQPVPNQPAPTAPPALYGVQTMLFGADGRSTYVALLPNLDVQQTVKLATAREFPEYSPTDPVSSAVIVSNGEKPELTRYTISDGNAWTQEQTVSFAQFTSEPIDAAIYASADKAYVPFDETDFIRWNPSTFTVAGPVDPSPSIPLTLR